MPTKPTKPTRKQKTESERQAEWVHAHPTVDSAASEYPDEKARRGASRGALPNGNPWKPETPPAKRDTDWTRATSSSEVTRETLPEDFCERTTLPATDARTVEAPPMSHLRTPVVQKVGTTADARVLPLVAERIAESKSFDDCRIELRMNQGEVEIRGIVGSEAERFEAEHLVSSVRGVVRVVNHLRVQRVEGTASRRK
jgi:hypothetical protein